VAALVGSPRVAAGLDDGRIWAAELSGTGAPMLKAEKGPAITALAWSPDGSRLAWGDEDGGAGVLDQPLFG